MESFHEDCVKVVTQTFKSLKSQNIHPLPSWFSKGMSSILETFTNFRNDLYENNKSDFYPVYMQLLAYTCYETANAFNSIPDSLNSVKFWIQKCLEFLHDCEGEDSVYLSNEKESLKSCANEILVNISEILNSPNATHSKENIHGDLLMCLALLQFDISVPPSSERHKSQADSCYLLSKLFRKIGNPEMQSFYEHSQATLLNHILNDMETKSDFVNYEKEIEETVISELKFCECTLEEVVLAVAEKLNISDKLGPNEESFTTEFYLSTLLSEFLSHAEEGIKLLCKDGLSLEQKLKVIDQMGGLTSIQLIPSIEILNKFRYAKLIPLYINKFDKQKGQSELQKFRYQIVERFLNDLKECKPEIEFIRTVANCFVYIKNHEWFLHNSLLGRWYEGNLNVWEMVLNACKQVKAEKINEEGCVAALNAAANALIDTKDFKLKLPLRNIISNAKAGSVETVKVIELQGGRKVIEVAGQFIWLSRVFAEIDSKLATDRSIQEVRFVGGNVMYIDMDVNWPGINVGVYVPKLFIEEIRRWNLSGKNSDHTFTSDAESEKEGEDGCPGESGGNVVLNIKTTVNSQLLTITSNGGKGSNGQNGGKGSDGEKGVGMSMDDFKKYFPSTAVSGEEFFRLRTTMGNIVDAPTELSYPVFKEGRTKVGTGHEVIFSHGYYWCQHAFCLVKGTKGKGGNSGREGGLGGEGGFPGSLNSSYPGINFVATKGYDGESGKRGPGGCHGKDGWDMGYIDRSVKWSGFYPKYYGGEGVKLKLVSHDSMGNSDEKWLRQYSNKKERWYSFETSSIPEPSQQKHEQENQNQQQRNRRQHAKATRKNNVSEIDATSKYFQFSENFEENYLNDLDTQLSEAEEKSVSVLENISSTKEMQHTYKASTKATYSARENFSNDNSGQKPEPKFTSPNLNKDGVNLPKKEFNFENFLQQLLKGDETALEEFQVRVFDFNQILLIAENPKLQKLLPPEVLRQKYVNAFLYEVTKTISANANFFGDYKNKVNDNFAVDPRLYLTQSSDSFILEEDDSNIQYNFEFASETVKSKVANSFETHAEMQSYEWKLCLQLFCSEVELVTQETEILDKFVVEYSKFCTTVQTELNGVIENIKSLIKSDGGDFGWIISKIMKLGQNNSASILRFFEKRISPESFIKFKEKLDNLETVLKKEFDLVGYFKSSKKDLITSAVVSHINDKGTDSKVYKEILARDSSSFIRVYSKSNYNDTLESELLFEDFGDPKSLNVSYFLQKTDLHLIPLNVDKMLKKLNEDRKLMARVFKHVLSDPDISSLEFDMLLKIKPSSYVSQITKIDNETSEEAPGTKRDAPDSNTEAPNGNTDLKEDSSSKINYQWYCLLQKHSNNELDYILSIKAFFPTSFKLLPLLEKLRSSFLGPNLILYQIYSRLQSEGCHISESTLEFLISSVLNWKTSCPPCMKIVTWILASYPQNNWADEVFILQLEDFLSEEMSFEQKTTWQQILTPLTNKAFYIYIKLKLDNITQNKSTVLGEIKRIVTSLGKLKNEGAVLENVKSQKLIDWIYIIQRQYWMDQVNSLPNFTEDEVYRIVSYLYQLQNLHGFAKTEKMYKLIMNLDKSRALKFLEEFYNNENILQSTSEADVSNLNLEEIEREQNSVGSKDRNADTLINMIQKCANTCAKFKTDVLPKLRNDIQPFEPDLVVDFKSWASSANSETTLKEALQIVDFAISKETGHNLRDTQKITILGMLKNRRSTLAQVSTGEGKTFIAVACAIISAALYKKTIEIVTSSTVLAKRDAKLNSKLYELFGISVGHNCFEDLEERKKSYAENQVIYSDLGGLQRDYLEHYFLGKNVLGSRKLDCSFLDEVDSMLLDKGNATLYLTHLIALLDKLETLYIFIWKSLLSRSAEEIDGDPDLINTIKREVWSDVYGLLDKPQITSLGEEFKGMEEQIWSLLIKSNVIDSQGRLKKHINQNAIKQLQLSLNGFLQFESRIKFLLTQIVYRKRSISLPICLLEYFDLHLESFIKNAVVALAMEEKGDYVIDTNGHDVFPTVIILNKETGTDEKNAQWEEALHQILLLKHGCRLSPQTLKSVFISNVSFIKLYGIIYGLSGTLGSQQERDLLKEIYGVQIFTVPTSKPRRFKEVPPSACSNDGEWIQSICKITTDFCKTKDRSVLTICDTIKQAETVAKAMENNEDGILVNTYTRDYEEFQFGSENKLPSCYNVISTNLAGRGTDVRLEDKLKESGGLHVILINIPNNTRVGQQAYGRASRCGEPGSGQLIVLTQNIFREMIEQMEAETRRQAEVKADYEERIKKEESAFTQFFQVYQICQRKLAEKEKEIQEILLTSVKDQWAFWLDRNGEKLKTHPLGIEEFLERLRDLNADSYEDWLNGDIIRLTSLGKYLSCKGQHSKANSLFDRVINSDPTQSAFAHYYKAFNLGKAQASDNEVKTELLQAKRLFTQLKETAYLNSAIMRNLRKCSTSYVQTKGYDTQQENIASIYSAFINSCDDILGRDVIPEYFESYKVNRFMAKRLFDDLMKKGIVCEPSYNTSLTEAMQEISREYGVPCDTLRTLIESSKGDPVLFRKQMKSMNVFPSRELFWKLMVKIGVFVDEVKLVSFDSSELHEIDPALNSKLKSLATTSPIEKHLILYPSEKEKSTGEEMVAYDKAVFKATCGIEQYKCLKQIELLSFNKCANFCESKIEGCNQLEHFDFLKRSDMKYTGIMEADEEEILKQLVEKKILIFKDDGYKLNVPFSEVLKINLEKFSVYNSAILFVLYNRFAYRGALEELQNQNTYGTGFKLELYPLPATQIYFDLKDRHVFQGSRLVEINEDKLIEKLSTIPDQFIQQTKSPSSDKPNIIPIQIQLIVRFYQKWSDDVEEIKSIAKVLLQTVGTIQSVKNKNFCFRKLTDRVNTPENISFNDVGFNQLIFIDEKKWSFEMIINCITVIIIGLCQIAIGLLMQIKGGPLGFIGEGLMVEGFGDIIFTISCLTSGHFSWKNYGEHKKQSLMLTCATVGVGAFLSRGTQFSFYGQKLAHPTLMIGGKCVAQMTGKTLIRTVGGKAIARQFMKSIAQKVGEALAIGLVNEGVDLAVKNYFQGLCNQVTADINGEIEKAVLDHKVSAVIEQAVKQLGREKAMELIRHKSERFFGECTSSKITGKLWQVKNSISQGVNDASAKINGSSGKVIKIASVLGKVLTAVKWIDRVKEISKITSSFLSSIEREVSKELEKKEGTGNEVSQEDLENFKKEVTAYWSQFLKEEVGKLVSQNFVSPLLKYVTEKCVKGASKVVKSGFAAIMAGIQNDKVTHLKKNYRKKLDSLKKESSLSKEQLQLNKNYERNLLKILSKTKSPKVFAKIVQENIPLDLTCVQACTNMVQQYLESQRNLKGTHLTVKINGDDGISQEFYSSSGSDIKHSVVINLNLNDNHFSLSGLSSNSAKPADGNNCLLDCLKSSIGFDISPDEFRSGLSSEILNRTDIKYSIRQGWHSLPAKMGLIGGYQKRWRVDTHGLICDGRLSNITRKMQTVQTKSGEMKVTSEASCEIPFNVGMGKPTNRACRDFAKSFDPEAIAAHIFSASFDGDNSTENMFPSSHSFNATHYHQFEKHIKDFLDDKVVMGEYNLALKDCKPHLVYHCKLNYAECSPRSPYLIAKHADISIELKNSNPEIQQRFERIFNEAGSYKKSPQDNCKFSTRISDDSNTKKHKWNPKSS